MQDLHGALVVGNELLRLLRLSLTIVNDLNVLLLCIHLQYFNERANGILWVEHSLMKAKVIVAKVLVCN